MGSERFSLSENGESEPRMQSELRVYAGRLWERESTTRAQERNQGGSNETITAPDDFDNVYSATDSDEDLILIDEHSLPQSHLAIGIPDVVVLDESSDEETGDDSKHYDRKFLHPGWKPRAASVFEDSEPEDGDGVEDLPSTDQANIGESTSSTKLESSDDLDEWGLPRLSAEFAEFDDPGLLEFVDPDLFEIEDSESSDDEGFEFT